MHFNYINTNKIFKILPCNFLDKLNLISIKKKRANESARKFKYKKYNYAFIFNSFFNEFMWLECY